MSSLDKAVRAIGNDLACPVCSGQTVADSQSLTAKQMQAYIRSQLGLGEKPQDIQQNLASQWGEGILLAPQDQWLWWYPCVAAGLVVFGLVWVWGKRNRKSD